jgi:hypothetical protein
MAIGLVVPLERRRDDYLTERVLGAEALRRGVSLDLPRDLGRLGMGPVASAMRDSEFAFLGFVGPSVPGALATSALMELLG